MGTVELLCHGLLREYLARKGCSKTLATFDGEQPRNESSITNRKILAQTLHIGKLITKNKERGDIYTTFLEMIVDFLSNRYQTEPVNDNLIPKPMSSAFSSQDSPSLRSRPPVQPSPNQQQPNLQISPQNNQLQSSQEIKESSPSRLSRRGSSSNLRVSVSDMTVSDFDSHPTHEEQPTNDTNGTRKSSQRTRESPLRSRDPSPNPASPLLQTSSILRDPSPMRASSPMRSSSPLRSREVSSPDLGVSSPKRVAFALDSPKWSEEKKGFGTSSSMSSLNLSFNSSSTNSNNNNNSNNSNGIQNGVAAERDDIVSKHARVNGIIKTAAPKLELEPAAPTNVLPTPNQEPIETAASIADLDKLVFGMNFRGPKIFQDEWHQGFFFSDNSDLRYGLVQLHGGPCGVIAAVQSYILKELIFSPIFQKYGFNPPDAVRNTALINSLSEILWQTGGSKSVKLVLNPAMPKRYKQYKLADWTVVTLTSVNDLQHALRTNIASFTERSGCGVLLLVYSVILTRGVSNVRSDMDVSDSTLLAPHKYCSQELVNLIITGKATSNVFDGKMNMEGASLKGIANRGSVGFLTLMEKMGYCEVGNNLKSPVFPIWILYSESHYSLLFATQSPAAPKFDLIYYDELGNQDEQYKITVDITSLNVTKIEDEDMVSPIEMCILTKWPNASCNWNGSEPLL